MVHKMKRSYGFLTTDSFIVEVEAHNPQQAYNLAVKKSEHIRKAMSETRKKFGLPIEGKVTHQYVTYGKTGFIPVGIYKTVKLSKAK